MKLRKYRKPPVPRGLVPTVDGLPARRPAAGDALVPDPAPELVPVNRGPWPPDADAAAFRAAYPAQFLDDKKDW